LEVQLILPKSNLTGASWDTRFSLYCKNHVPGDGGSVHVCSKHVAQAGGFHYMHCMYALLNL
jgi:hypothetical protein